MNASLVMWMVVFFSFSLLLLAVTPTSQPSQQPTHQPTRTPTRQPTTHPSRQPSQQPVGKPTMQPTRCFPYLISLIYNPLLTCRSCIVDNQRHDLPVVLPANLHNNQRERQLDVQCPVHHRSHRDSQHDSLRCFQHDCLQHSHQDSQRCSQPGDPPFLISLI